MRESNWAGTYTYRAERLHRPSTLEEAQELVARAPRLRVLGSRHSFNDIADSAELLSLDALPADVSVDPVFEGLGWDVLFERFDAITAAGDSVSVFTDWGPSAGQLWVKRRVTGAPEDVRGDLFGAVAAAVERHPILGLDPVNCSPQLGVAGPWWDRLPHVPRAPHWGKMFLGDAAPITPRYERARDFARLAERLDPRGAFRNAWLERHVLTGLGQPPSKP